MASTSSGGGGESLQEDGAQAQWLIYQANGSNAAPMAPTFAESMAPTSVESAHFSDSDEREGERRARDSLCPEAGDRTEASLSTLSDASVHTPAATPPPPDTPSHPGPYWGSSQDPDVDIRLPGKGAVAPPGDSVAGDTSHVGVDLSDFTQTVAGTAEEDEDEEDAASVPKAESPTAPRPPPRRRPRRDMAGMAAKR